MTSTKSNLTGTLAALSLAAILMIGTVSGFKSIEKAANPTTQNVVLQADGTAPPPPPIKFSGNKRA
jgi:hypothetical protein